MTDLLQAIYVRKFSRDPDGLIVVTAEVNGFAIWEEQYFKRSFDGSTGGGLKKRIFITLNSSRDDAISAAYELAAERI